MKSLGFVEVSGVVAAVDALDIMCKSADVSLVTWERKLGGRLVTLVVTGSVSAVTAAVDNACARCIKKPCASAVIANPHPETVRLAELSAKRLEKQAQAKKATKGGKKAAKPAEPQEVVSEQITISDPIVQNKTEI
ncbi:MAG: BMC domain-containing protein [Clostridia bacterium]|nr:BMC domain-containing protein [Clostridia bacterium]